MRNTEEMGVHMAADAVAVAGEAVVTEGTVGAGVNRTGVDGAVAAIGEADTDGGAGRRSALHTTGAGRTTALLTTMTTIMARAQASIGEWFVTKIEAAGL